MKYIEPLNADGTSKPEDSGYVTGNAATGTQGDYVDGRAIEHPMREIVTAIIGLGGVDGNGDPLIPPDEADTTQLRQAIEVYVASAVGAIDTSVPAATTEAAGAVELATTAEAAALTDATRVLTPAGLGSMLGQSRTATGYQRLPGGLIIQWGSYDLPTGFSAANADINFPITFPTACFAVVGSLGVSASDLDVNSYRTANHTLNIGVSSITRCEAHALIHNLTGSQRRIQWCAIGW